MSDQLKNDKSDALTRLSGMTDEEWEAEKVLECKCFAELREVRWANAGT
jgi:hypothetical protein